MNWTNLSKGGLTIPTISSLNNDIAKSLGITLPPQKEPFVPERLISPIPGDHQLDNAWTIEPGTPFAFVGKANEMILNDQNKRRAQYGDPLPVNILAERYNVPMSMWGDNYLMDLVKRTQYYPDEQYKVNNSIDENNHPKQDDSPLGVLTRAFDPNQNGVAAAFDPNKNGVAAALDPNQNGVAAALDPNKNGVAAAFTDVGNTIKTGVTEQVIPELKSIGETIKEGVVDKAIPELKQIGETIKTGLEENVLPVLKDIGGILKPPSKPLVKTPKQVVRLPNPATYSYLPYLAMAGVAVGAFIIIAT